MPTKLWVLLSHRIPFALSLSGWICWGFVGFSGGIGGNLSFLHL